MNTVVPNVLSDPGGVRPVVARWRIEAELVLESATHLGGGPGETADMVVLRDPRSGRPLLPGTSIAGALRSHLADVLGGYLGEEDPRVSCLFGGTRGDDVGEQSPLIVFDSLGLLPDGRSVEIRDGVQIDTAWGTAEDHKKFDFEVLPAGTRFPLRFDLVVPAVEEEQELVSLLVAALSGLSCGDIAFGARRSRGLGMARGRNWRAVRYDLASKHGWMQWLLCDDVAPLPAEDAGAHNDPARACRRAATKLQLRQYQDSRRRIVADLDLVLEGGLLVRSAPVTPDAPDAAHLQSAGRSVLPGTGVAGVLRKEALRIASVVREVQGDAQSWVEGLFGPRMEGTEGDASVNPYASRLRISEGVIEQGVRVRPTRVRVDRFTHGVVRGALFDEEIEGRGTSRVRIELREPRPGELGLLVLLLKDLLSAHLAVGGSASVGRGLFRGKATVRLENGDSAPLDPDGPADSRIEAAIQEFWNLPSVGGAE